jgi:alanyl-tRNA synthetase
MTERLYYDDAYLTAFDAVVLRCQAQDGQHRVLLNQTAFYPTSGGQPHDTGVLIAGAIRHTVTDVVADADGNVWHTIGMPLPEGSAVHGEIDWPRRFDHMQQHLGEHVLAGAIHELLGGYTIGLHMGASTSTIDVTMPDKRLRLTEAEVLTLEETVNGRLQQNLAVKCWFPDAQELQRLPLRKPPPAVNNVRIVDVGGIEMVACGGTHPATTGQAGQLKVLDTQPARGKMRVSFVCGMRTVRYFHALYNTAVQAGRLLSSSPEALADATSKMVANMANLRAELAQMKKASVLAQADRCLLSAQPLPRGWKLAAAELNDADMDSLGSAAAHLTASPGVIALLAAAAETGYTVVFARSADVDLDMRKVIQQAGVRGGGRNDFARGAAESPASLAKAEQFVIHEAGSARSENTQNSEQY